MLDARCEYAKSYTIYNMGTNLSNMIVRIKGMDVIKLIRRD
jgi:hypothetical protein